MSIPPSSSSSPAPSPPSPVSFPPRSASLPPHPSLSPSFPHTPSPSRHFSPHHFSPSPSPRHYRVRSSLPAQRYTRPRGLRIANCLKSWFPLIAYGITTLAFVVAISLWKTEVFTCLDDLSQWLRADERYGHAILFMLIFLTTIPPIPLYSTLIVLSGYTFGAWTGALISYLAALTGALVVFHTSRTLLRAPISRWLARTCSIKRVVRAIEKRPKLLFLVRLAPYPYNLMNCLLAASPTLTLRTYAVCTALSLCKVIIHTWLGASIHSFKDYHVVLTPPINDDGYDGEVPVQPPVPEEGSANKVARLWTILGILLCIALFVYLTAAARRAVDEELEDDEDEDDVNEERVAFLAPSSSLSDLDVEASSNATPMTETPLSTRRDQSPYRLILS